MRDCVKSQNIIHKIFLCGRFANAAGAITITGIGARTALPSLKEVERFLKIR